MANNLPLIPFRNLSVSSSALENADTIVAVLGNSRTVRVPWSTIKNGFITMSPGVPGSSADAGTDNQIALDPTGIYTYYEGQWGKSPRVYNNWDDFTETTRFLRVDALQALTSEEVEAALRNLNIEKATTQESGLVRLATGIDDNEGTVPTTPIVKKAIKDAVDELNASGLDLSSYHGEVNIEGPDFENVLKYDTTSSTLTMGRYIDNLDIKAGRTRFFAPDGSVVLTIDENFTIDFAAAAGWTKTGNITYTGNNVRITGAGTGDILVVRTDTLEEVIRVDEHGGLHFVENRVEAANQNGSAVFTLRNVTPDGVVAGVLQTTVGSDTVNVTLGGVAGQAASFIFQGKDYFGVISDSIEFYAKDENNVEYPFFGGGYTESGTYPSGIVGPCVWFGNTRMPTLIRGSEILFNGSTLEALVAEQVPNLVYSVMYAELPLKPTGNIYVSTTPAGTDNFNANNIEVDPMWIPPGILKSISLSGRTSGQSSPFFTGWIGVWELNRDGVSWTRLGASDSARTMAQSQITTWTFNNTQIPLSGRRLFLLPMSSPDEQEMGSTANMFNLRVSSPGPGDTSTVAGVSWLAQFSLSVDSPDVDVASATELHTHINDHVIHLTQAEHDGLTELIESGTQTGLEEHIADNVKHLSATEHASLTDLIASNVATRFVDHLGDLVAHLTAAEHTSLTALINSPLWKVENALSTWQDYNTKEEAIFPNASTDKKLAFGSHDSGYLTLFQTLNASYIRALNGQLRLEAQWDAYFSSPSGRLNLLAGTIGELTANTKQMYTSPEAIFRVTNHLDHKWLWYRNGEQYAYLIQREPGESASAATTIYPIKVKDYNTHLENQDVHVNIGEKTAWNAKANSADLNLHVNNGTVHVTSADKSAWNAKIDSATFTAHTSDSIAHITQSERNNWNAKLDSSVLSAHVDNGSVHVTSAKQAAWDAKADQTALQEHATDQDIHVTAAETQAWDAHVSNMQLHVNDQEKAKLSRVSYFPDLGELNSDKTLSVGLPADTVLEDGDILVMNAPATDVTDVDVWTTFFPSDRVTMPLRGACIRVWVRPSVTATAETSGSLGGNFTIKNQWNAGCARSGNQVLNTVAPNSLIEFFMGYQWTDTAGNASLAFRITSFTH